MIIWSTGTDDAIANVRTFIPDIILFDIYLNEFERLDVLHRIKLEYPQIPVIIMTAYKLYLHDPHFAHADGYVIKEVHTGSPGKKS